MNDAIRAEWSARVIAEYRSAAITQQLGHLLLIAGVSPSLVAESHRVVLDELVHAEQAVTVLRDAGGTPPVLDVGTLKLDLPSTDPRLSVLLLGAEQFAMSESIAVPLFQAMQARAGHPAAVETLHRIAEDEPRHALFGWTLVAWAMQAWPELVPALRAAMPAAVNRLREAYGAYPDQRFAPDDARWHWALIDGATYANVLESGLHKHVRPRLRELGLD